MPVIYDQTAKTITIHTARSSYQMKVGMSGLLLHTYYGPTAWGDMSYCLSYRDRGFSGNPFDVGNNRTFSADVLPLEYSCMGNGDYRPTAFSLTRQNGAPGCDLRYTEHKVLNGKYSLPGLPAVHAESDAETLVVTLADAGTGVVVTLQYGVLPELDVITRAVLVENRGKEPVVLNNAASLSLDLMSGDWDLINFAGRHCGERAPHREAIDNYEIVIGSRRGTSSHQQNPFVILADRDANEQSGCCIGISLLYSGAYCANVSKDQFDLTRLVMGVQSECFDYPLEPGESFQTPETAMIFSTEGLSRLSQLNHKLILDHICRSPWTKRRCPVLINNWEATGMDFDGEKVLSIARKAAELGVEMMVLDDGWFGARNDDNAGLGDWTVNEDKLGCTIGQLADQIRGMGMKFGIWIEPEGVNEDSDLYRSHPDWALAVPGKNPVRGRNQLILDFSREDVVDHVFDQIAAVLDECRPDYVKMDMNRSLADIYSASQARQSQGKTLYRYTLGVYRFMEKLLARYPNLLLEGCSGGGGRFDAGMLYYCPQIWCSDNTDAIDRIRIQYGTSFAYPIRSMGAHVSAVPNYDTHRVTPFHTRAVIAMSGTFGYELDLNLISDAEKQEVSSQISDFKKYWELLHLGRYYRLTDVMNNRKEAAWMMVAEDGSEALLNIVTLDATGNCPNRFVRCAGLTPGTNYQDEESGMVYPAGALMSQGLPMPETQGRTPGEYEAFQIHLIRIS